MSPDAIARRIAEVAYESRGDVTLCRITLDNGHAVTAESFCAPNRPFSAATGRRLAYGKAFLHLKALLTFAEVELRFRARHGVGPDTCQDAASPPTSLTLN